VPATESIVRLIKSSLAGVKTYFNVSTTIKGSASKITTGLHPNVVGNFVILDQTPYELEVGVTRSGICDLDLLHSTLHQLPEEQRLLFYGHRICKGLVTIPQIS
jgi:hypothetical protein